MHVTKEIFLNLFLTPAEIGQLRVELPLLTGEFEIDWQKFPAWDRLTDALMHNEHVGEEM